jgi:hypothetical protein
MTVAYLEVLRTGLEVANHLLKVLTDFPLNEQRFQSAHYSEPLSVVGNNLQVPIIISLAHWELYRLLDTIPKRTES